MKRIADGWHPYSARRIVFTPSWTFLEASSEGACLGSVAVGPAMCSPVPGCSAPAPGLEGGLQVAWLDCVGPGGLRGGGLTGAPLAGFVRSGPSAGCGEPDALSIWSGAEGDGLGDGSLSLGLECDAFEVG